MNTKYKHTESDSWVWRRAVGPDVASMVLLTKSQYQGEIDQIHTPQDMVLARNLTLGVVNQLYNEYSELVLVARDRESNELRAYTWAARGFRPSWSDDEEICIKIAHVDLAVSPRDRVTLVNQMLNWWELWALDCAVPVICSTTNRNDQSTFLKIHERNGYDVRGSFAYKRVIPMLNEVSK